MLALVWCGRKEEWSESWHGSQSLAGRAYRILGVPLQLKKGNCQRGGTKHFKTIYKYLTYFLWIAQ